MRKRLKDYEGQSVNAVGTFECFGKKKNIVKSRRGKFVRVKFTPTILIKDVYIDGNFVCKHIWLNLEEKPFVEIGDKVFLKARVEMYIKGHSNTYKNKINGNLMEYGMNNVKILRIEKRGFCENK